MRASGCPLKGRPMAGRDAKIRLKFRRDAQAARRTQGGVRPARWSIDPPRFPTTHWHPTLGGPWGHRASHSSNWQCLHADQQVLPSAGPPRPRCSRKEVLSPSPSRGGSVAPFPCPSFEQGRDGRRKLGVGVHVVSKSAKRAIAGAKGLSKSRCRCKLEGEGGSFTYLFYM
jgi:hypothetical protein